jgi:ribosome-associated protein
MTVSYAPSVEPYIKAVLGMKAFNVVILDVEGIASFADTFILCSGRSHRQVSAIAEFVQTELKRKGTKPLGVEGLREGHWVLMDYGDIIIHVFYEPVRMFYDLEGLWSDAKRIEIDGGSPPEPEKGEAVD